MPTEVTMMRKSDATPGVEPATVARISVTVPIAIMAIIGATIIAAIIIGAAIVVVIRPAVTISKGARAECKEAKRCSSYCRAWVPSIVAVVSVVVMPIVVIVSIMIIACLFNLCLRCHDI
jgi:hypothetical protein